MIIRLELFDVPATLDHVLFCMGVLIIASACVLCYDLEDGSATLLETSHQDRPVRGMIALQGVRGVTYILTYLSKTKSFRTDRKCADIVN